MPEKIREILSGAARTCAQFNWKARGILALPLRAPRLRSPTCLRHTYRTRANEPITDDRER